MKYLILCGGSGTRLFPVSREKYPKQFIKIFDDKSLFIHTFERISSYASPKDIYISTADEYRFLVIDQLKDFNIEEKNIITEPLKKNTAPAIALSLKYMIENGIKEDEVVFVSPSDHYLKPKNALNSYFETVEKIGKEGFILTFGIKPFRPDTGYGYIETGKAIDNNVYKVVKFHEKPNIELAKEYFSKDNFFWNSGMFAFSIKTFKEELKKHLYEIYELIFEAKDFKEAVNNFEKLPDISIDYAIMEKTDKAVVIPADFVWSDVGSWDAVFDILPKDEKGVAKNEKTISLDSENVMILNKDETNGKLAIAIGLKDIYIIETRDVILVIKKGLSQKVKDVVKIIKNNKELSHFAETSPIEHRPWGYFIEFEASDRYRIKRIHVNPGASLSLQMHYHRSEHWIVVKGTAKVVMENQNGEVKEYYIHENESIYVPKTTKHKLTNPGKIPLELIEVQVGEYVGEDDIVRFQDIYGRIKD